jgi:hypothetical protein
MNRYLPGQAAAIDASLQTRSPRSAARLFESDNFVKLCWPHLKKQATKTGIQQELM